MTTIRGLCKRIGWLAAVVLIVAGCRTIQSRGDVAGHPQTTGAISRVLVLWSEAVLRQDNKPVAQGFAGKAYLFGPDSDKPVTAPGKFTIFAYDDTGRANDRPEAHIKPDYTWELLECDLKQLLKKDAIGWSYSLWLPCGPPAATERRYSLMLCFKADNGSQALSESTLVTLPALRGAPKSTLAQSRQTRPPMNETGSPVSLAGNLTYSP